MNLTDRVFLILRLFTVERPAWPIEEAAAALGVSVSTAYRQFGALVEFGLLDLIEGDRVYVLGPAIIELDRNIRHSDPLVSAARPAMKWLAEQAGAPCSILLCRFYRDRVMCVHEEAAGAVGLARVSYERGRLMPLSRGAPSKVILAQLPPRRLRALEENLAAEMGPSFSLKDFRRELAALRRQGYAVTFGEVDADVIGVAAPLATASGGIVASLGVACFDHPDERALARMRALLLAAVEMTKGAVVRR